MATQAFKSVSIPVEKVRAAYNGAMTLSMFFGGTPDVVFSYEDVASVDGRSTRPPKYMPFRMAVERRGAEVRFKTTAMDARHTGANDLLHSRADDGEVHIFLRSSPFWNTDSTGVIFAGPVGEWSSWRRFPDEYKAMDCVQSIVRSIRKLNRDNNAVGERGYDVEYTIVPAEAPWEPLSIVSRTRGSDGKTEVKILTQDERDRKSMYFVASNGLAIKSCSVPEFNHPGQSVYVRGTSKEADNVCRVLEDDGVRTLANFQKAVRELNESRGLKFAA